MLDLMLGNSQQAFSCGEVYALFRPWRTHHFKIACACGRDPCPVWERIKHCREKDFHKSVFRELGVTHVVDSSKDLAWVLDSNRWAIRDGIKAVNLVMWKEPVDLAYSYWKRGLDPWRFRNDMVNYLGRLLKLGISFIALSYNELARDPAEKLKQVCKAVGMDYFEGKERFWEKEHHHLFGSHHTRVQVQEGSSSIRPREDYDPGFREKAQMIDEANRKDEEIQNILSSLSNKEASTLAAASAHNDRVPRINPPWYYRKRARFIYRRYMPERFAEGE